MNSCRLRVDVDGWLEIREGCVGVVVRSLGRGYVKGWVALGVKWDGRLWGRWKCRQE